jgi:hypothetical protein
MAKSNLREVCDEDREFAQLIAMVVRNTMEDFHVAHLTDVQMAELNPIIRGAIVTALHAMRHAKRHKAALAFLSFQQALIPDYWEPPVLTDDFLGTLQMYEDDPDMPIPFLPSSA